MGAGGTTGPRGWVDDAGVAAALGDGIAVLGPDGSVVWANDALEQMLGLDRGQLLGRDGVALLHPDDRARAADGVAYAAQFPGRASVVPYRVLRADGSALAVELKSAVIERDDEAHLGLVIRDGTPRHHLHRALGSVARGEPFGVTARSVVRSILARWPATGVAVSVADRRSGREVIASDLPEVLIDHARGKRVGPGGRQPWHGGGPPGTVTVHERGELPPALAAGAEDAGFEAVGIAPIADPALDPGCLVVWFDHAAVARLEFSHAAVELTELLGLALDRRHHLWRLWHSARHDELTGLWNRAGFLERLREVVAQARRDGLVAFLLYLDLDGLKAVNDRDGHAAGDRVLAAVADALGPVVGEGATLARLGGDEFTVLGTAAPGRADDDADRLAAAVVSALAHAHGTPVTASVGIALDDGEVAPERLLEAADDAMYRAKAAGPGRWMR